MKKTWIDLLLELPVDRTLRNFLTVHGLAMPADFAWTDKPGATQALIAALLASDAAVRDAVDAELRASVGLGDVAGRRAMFQAAAGNAAVLDGLATCKSDAHRSFVLYVNHPDLFDRASDIDRLERHVARAQQYDLGVKKIPDTSDAALAALRRDISAFYQHEMQCGDRCKVYVVERSPGVYLLSVKIKDLPDTRTEFKGDELERHVGNPAIHAVLEYSSRTGVARLVVKGGAKYYEMLLKAFGAHLLHVKLHAHRLRPPTLDLSVLLRGVNIPQAQADTFVALQVKEITLLSPDGKLKSNCTAMASHEQRSVTDLLAQKLRGLLEENWLVVAAKINFYPLPAPGRGWPKVAPVEITRKSCNNLHEYDAWLWSKLEACLVSLGILQQGQTLDAQESLPPVDVSDSEH